MRNRHKTGLRLPCFLLLMILLLNGWEITIAILPQSADHFLNPPSGIQREDISRATRGEAIRYYDDLPVFVPDRFWEKFFQDLTQFSLQIRQTMRATELKTSYQNLIDKIHTLRVQETERALTQVDLLQLRSLLGNFIGTVGSFREQMSHQYSHSQLRNIQNLTNVITAYYNPGGALEELFPDCPLFRTPMGELVLIGFLDSDGRLYKITRSVGIFAQVDQPEQKIYYRDPSRSSGGQALFVRVGLELQTAEDVIVASGLTPDAQELGIREQGRERRVAKGSEEYARLWREAENSQRRSVFPSSQILLADNGVLLTSDEVEERALDSIQKLGIRPLETALVIGSKSPFIFAMRGAMTIVVEPDPEKIRIAQEVEKGLKGFVELEGGSVIYVEGDIQTPKVKAFLTALSPFDHVIDIESGKRVPPRTLARFKKPDRGSIYVGPIDDHWQQGSDYESEWRENGIGIPQASPAVTPFSYGVRKGSIYKHGAYEQLRRGSGTHALLEGAI